MKFAYLFPHQRQHTEPPRQNTTECAIRDARIEGPPAPMTFIPLPDLINDFLNSKHKFFVAFLRGIRISFSTSLLDLKKPVEGHVVIFPNRGAQFDRLCAAVKCARKHLCPIEQAVFASLRHACAKGQRGGKVNFIFIFLSKCRVAPCLIVGINNSLVHLAYFFCDEENLQSAPARAKGRVFRI
ncbi:hypothetical protein [Celeribacter halophilus]|uniref:hypothetical protein n=1 Tax=Celeribacter halophilus TaxID=576117 RepID=UPI003A93638E